MDTPTRPPTRRVPSDVLDFESRGSTPQSDAAAWVLPPDVRRWDPFVLISEDRFSTVGFPWHPHRGFQTLTFVLDGELEHEDNAGGHGVLGPGDAQYMVAGRYALHSEMAHQLRPVHTLQAWINLPAERKLGPTSYVDLRADAATRLHGAGVEGRLHVGTAGDRTGADPAAFVVDLTVADLRLQDGARFVHELPGDHGAAVLVLEGAVEAGGTRVGPRQAAWLEAGEPGASVLDLHAARPARVLVYSGRPVGESVVFDGPWLMNTHEEAREADADFRAGRFGRVPVRVAGSGGATR